MRNEFYSVTNKNLIEKNDRIFKTILYPHNDCFVSSGYSGSDFNIETTEDLKSGKIVGKKIINNALSYASKEYTGSGYCFIDLKDLEAQLMQYKQDLSHHIIVAYCQSKEITLTDVLIHKNSVERYEYETTKNSTPIEILCP